MLPMRLDVERVAEANGHMIARLRGKLCLETVHGFIQTMRTEPAAHLVLDMSDVSFVDSAGVGALTSLFVSRRNHERSFALAGLTQQCSATLQVAGLTKLLPTFPTIEAALQSRNRTA